MTPRKVNYVQWKVTLDPTLAAQVELESWDPVLNKPRYRSRKELLEFLLRRWIAERHAERMAGILGESKDARHQQ